MLLPADWILSFRQVEQIGWDDCLFFLLQKQRWALPLLSFTLLLPIFLLHLSITELDWSSHSCWPSHCQSSSFSRRCTDGPPQVPAWKTADLRGTSCLINSSHKCESFPRWDWYTPPFASLASRDIRPCTSRVFWKFWHNLLKHRIRLWYSSEDSLAFHVAVP